MNGLAPYWRPFSIWTTSTLSGVDLFTTLSGSLPGFTWTRLWTCVDIASNEVMSGRHCVPIESSYTTSRWVSSINEMII